MINFSMLDPVLILLQGMAVLSALAVVIGILEHRARHEAWRRVADARRMVQERSLDLDVREERIRERERGPE